MKERLLSVLKLVLAVMLLPLAIGATTSLWENLRLLKISVSGAFGWGVVSYLILHILLFEPAQVYDTGKKLTEQATGFLLPMFKVAGFCFPVFTILSFLVYYLVSLTYRKVDLFGFFVFLAAFTFTMHIVMTANSLKRKQPGWLKENYLFTIFFVYIINLLIVAGAFTLLTDDFFFSLFWKRALEVAGAIYTASFKQLFVVEGR